MDEVSPNITGRSLFSKELTKFERCRKGFFFKDSNRKPEGKESYSSIPQCLVYFKWKLSVCLARYGFDFHFQVQLYNLISSLPSTNVQLQLRVDSGFNILNVS